MLYISSYIFAYTISIWTTCSLVKISFRFGDVSQCTYASIWQIHLLRHKRIYLYKHTRSYRHMRASIHKISTLFMNRVKGAMSAIIKEHEVIYSLTDKVKHISSIFPSNWTIDQKGHHFSKSPRNSVYNLSNLFTAWKISSHFKSHEPKTLTVPHKIPMIFLRNINPGIFPIRAKLFNCYLKYESFSSLWRVKRIPGFQERRRSHIPLSVYPHQSPQYNSQVF